MTILNRFRSTCAFAGKAVALPLGMGLLIWSWADRPLAPFATPAIVEAAGNLADGWMVRADSGAGQEDKLMAEGGSLHFMMGGPPSNNGAFYNASWTATGNHTFSAAFTQNTKATHPTGYGLMFGGSNLDGDNQMYSYFLVRQAGQFYIANRNGSMVTAVVPWTANSAIKPQGDDGKQSNTLSVQVTGNSVVFSVNGTEVSRQPAASLHVNGLYGFRIGHRLDVTVTNVAK